MVVVQYTELQKLNKEFQPFYDLWKTTSDWLRWHESWLNDPLSAINPEQLEYNVNDAYKTMHQCVKQFKDIPGEQETILEDTNKYCMFLCHTVPSIKNEKVFLFYK